MTQLPSAVAPTVDPVVAVRVFVALGGLLVAAYLARVATSEDVGIVLAAVSNTLLEAVVAWVLGTPRLGHIATGALVAASVAGLAVALLA